MRSHALCLVRSPTAPPQTTSPENLQIRMVYSVPEQLCYHRRTQHRSVNPISPFPFPTRFAFPASGRAYLRGVRTSLMARDGSKTASESPSFQYGQIYFKVARDSIRHEPIRFQVPSNPPRSNPQRPNLHQHRSKTNVFWCVRFFASDGLLRRQDDPEMAQGAPRGPQWRPRARERLFWKLLGVGGWN